MTVFDRLFLTMKKPLSLILFGLVVVFSFFYIDKPLAYYCHGLALERSDILIHALTRMGSSSLYLAGLLLLASWFRYGLKDKVWQSRALFLWACVLVSSLTCGVLKVLFGRARPVMLFDYSLYGLYGLHFSSEYWSFPSGHSAAIMAFVYGLMIIFPKYSYVSMVLGLLVVATRILLTQHYLSDVLVSIYLSLMAVGFLNYFINY